MSKVCTECEKPAEARGLCKKHYGQWYRRTHPVNRQEYHRRYYLENKERILADQRRVRKADPERDRLRYMRWKERHPEAWKRSKQRHKAKLYGLTLAQYDAIIARGCALCGTHERQLCVDHDHITGVVRDALCKGCNTGLGLFGDDPARLRAAADYLEAHRKVLAVAV